ncbi:MAG: 3-phosphoshikimate 1-carboxyvinyltransferase [Acidimicrobiales bacterium]
MSTGRAVHPLAAPPSVTLVAPGSKSHTNRALVCAGLAHGASVLRGALFADDTLAMVDALRALGAGIELDPADRSMRVDGVAGRPADGPVTLDVRQSGTTGRFLLAVLALGHGRYTLDGDPQLRARPMAPLAGALRRLGVRVEGDHLPITVHGAGLPAGEVAVDGAVSSQFLSALLLAAPGAVPGASAHELGITLAGPLVSRPYVDLTVSTMGDFGVTVERPEPNRFLVAPQAYRGVAVAIEPDASAASYLFAAAAVTGGRVRVDGLGRTTRQGDLGFVDVLARMGAEVEMTDTSTEVRGSGRLRGITVDMADISDTAPTLAVVASFADSPTTVTGVGFIAAKETDRITAVVTELNRRGITAVATDDGFVVEPSAPVPGVVETYDDHRMAMSFALLGLVHPGIVIADPDCVAKTFPDYFAVLNQLGPTVPAR